MRGAGFSPLSTGVNMVLTCKMKRDAGSRILTFVHGGEHGSYLQDETRCGEQDSNLRTNKEWDLNPPPLTKLGDPRADWGRRLLDLKQALHWDAEKPAFSISVMTSCAEIF